MDLHQAKGEIPIYICIGDIMELMGVGRPTATRVYRELKEEKKDIPIPNSKKIPLDWVIEKYGKKSIKATTK